MTSIDRLFMKVRKLSLQFLKLFCPIGRFGKNHIGKTCIGTIISGSDNGQDKTAYIYNICDHEAQGSGIASGQLYNRRTGYDRAAMMLTGKGGAGVFNMEQFDPDPFMDMLNQHGLPWQYVMLEKPLAF